MGSAGDGGEDGHGGVLAEVDVADSGDGFGADEGDVAGEDEQMFREGLAGELEVGFEHLEGVAGAALLGLQDELDAGGGDGGADAVGFVADDAEDVVGGDDGFGGGDDVEEEGLAADLVEDFGALAFEAGTFTGGHDGDGEFVGVHRGLSSHGESVAGRCWVISSRVALAAKVGTVQPCNAVNEAGWRGNSSFLFRGQPAVLRDYSAG